MVRALDWGSRSREFESHHSDGENRFLNRNRFFYLWAILTKNNMYT